MPSIPRPASLDGWPHRTEALVREAIESGAVKSKNDLLRQVNLTPAALHSRRPHCLTLIRLDDWTGQTLLSPQEREWAQQALREYRRQNERRYAR